MKRTRKPPPPEVAKVLDALKRRLRREDLTQQELGERLGWKGDYVRQVLGSRVELRYEHVVAFLTSLGVHPVEFFEEVYGLPPGRPKPLPPEVLPEDPGRYLIHWSSLRVLIWELKEKGIFTAEEAERLLGKLENAVPPV